MQISGFTLILIKLIFLYNLKNHIRKSIGGTNCAGGQSARLHRSRKNTMIKLPFSTVMYKLYTVQVISDRSFAKIFLISVDRLCFGKKLERF